MFRYTHLANRLMKLSIEVYTVFRTKWKETAEIERLQPVS